MAQKRKVTFLDENSDEDTKALGKDASLGAGSGGDDFPEDVDEGRTGGRKRKALREEDEDDDEDDDDDDGDEDDDGEGGEGKGVADGSKYELDMDTVEGQEDRTVDFNEAGEMITPFNLEEEEQEGHFDKDGMYQFKREKEGKDAWLDSVNWNKDVAHHVKETSASAVPAAEEVEPISESTELQRVLDVLKPGETVTKALKRLGGGASAAAGRKWQKKKPQPAGQQAGQSEEDKDALLKLTEAADRLLQSGYYNVYSDAREQVAAQLAEQPAMLAGKSSITIGAKSKEPDAKRQKTETKPAADMFSEDIYADDEPKEKKLDPPAAEKTESAAEDGPVSLSDSVQWEYKWKEGDDQEIFGPFSSENMRDWKDGGLFSDEVVVRKKGETLFYKCARIDFDLYT